MSPRAYIVVRKTAKGKSFHVRWKRAGDPTPVHWGAYPSKKLAERARDFVNGEFAVGRYPDAANLRGPEVRQSVAQAARAWIASHPDAEKARRQHRKALARLDGTPLARTDVQTATVDDVQAWVNHLAAGLAPATVRYYLRLVRSTFRHAGRNPSPANDPRLRLPHPHGDDVPEPPSWRQFQLLAEAITPRHRDALEFMERHGLRTKELGHLAWRDVDLAGRRVRVRVTKGGTGGVRWVPLFGDWSARLAARTPLEDRLPDALVFPEFNGNTFRGALARASRQTGSVLYSNHDLRHRTGSLLLLAGIDPVLAAKIMGHRRKSETIDTYGHVLLDEPEWRLKELRSGAARVSGLGPRDGETFTQSGTADGVGSTGIEPGGDREGRR